MELAILDRQFNRLAELDEYMSLIWNEAFKEAGDFELQLPQDSPLVQYLQKGNYIWKQDTNRVMMVRKIQTTTDAEEGSKAIITGRTLDWILHSRVIYTQLDSTNYTNVEDYIFAILDGNVINPAVSARKIPNFIRTSCGDSSITSMTIEDQATVGTNVYDKIVDICNAKDIGFRVFLTADNKFEFKLYKGADRTYAQSDNVYVVFSQAYDNLLESDYYTDADSVKNSAVIAGAKNETRTINITNSQTGETTAVSIPIAQIVTTVGDDVTGLDREEVYVDKGDISRFFKVTVPGTTDSADLMYDETVYKNILKEAGTIELDKYKVGEVFDAKVDPYGQFEYGRDFGIGDLVQIRDAFGREGVARVASYMVSDSPEGFQAYPTFEIQTENQNGG